MIGRGLRVGLYLVILNWGLSGVWGPVLADISVLIGSLR